MSLIFGQQPPGMTRMTGALIVQMAVKQVRLALFSSPEWAEAIDKYAQDNGITPETHAPAADRYPEERIVTERAQIMSVVLGEDEAELRFYWTSRTDINAIMQEHSVDLVYPVVEVRMPAEELIHLMHTLRDLIPAEAPQ